MRITNGTSRGVFHFRAIHHPGAGKAQPPVQRAPLHGFFGREQVQASHARHERGGNGVGAGGVLDEIGGADFDHAVLSRRFCKMPFSFITINCRLKGART